MWGTALSLFTLATAVAARTSLDFDPYIDIPFKSLKTSDARIREHGYPAESHYVTTSDGYILNIFRIPYSPRLNNQNERRPVVFLQHGMFSCSDCFLLNGPDNAIAYNFADAGFDVWLGNARGNIYSRNHSTLSLNHPYFYRFDWHEIGVIDMPQCIDYILDLTGESALHYVGHSQGGTTYFVMNAELPEYNDKIKTGHMLAPAVFMGNTTQEFALYFERYIGVPGGAGMNLMRDQVFIPGNMLIQRMLDTACGGNVRFPKYCRTLFMSGAATESTNINTTLLPQIAETHPAGVSTNQAIHFIQLHMSNMFRQLDYGERDNMKMYGTVEPPEYDLRQVVAATYIYYGLSDTSVHWLDLGRLPDYLSNLKLFYEVPDPTWSHMDFLFAKNVKSTINDPVIQTCVDYEDQMKY